MKQTDGRPKYRYALRAKIAEAGHRTLSGYSNRIGVNIARVSRIVTGWELPSSKLSQAMANELGLTLKEFKELL